MPSFLPTNLKGMAADFGLEVPTDMIYQSILGSRSLKDRIIERFNLREVYKMPEEAPYERLLNAFDSHYLVETRDDEALVISYEAKDPHQAAEIANAVVEELDNIYRRITSETARSNRIYIGKRLKQVTDSLDVLQDSLMRFQQATRAISISDQLLATITAAADLKAEQTATEIELEILRNNYGDSHPMVGQLQKTVRELSKQYNSVLYSDNSEVFIGLQELPKISRDYAALMREVRLQASLIEFIQPQFESAVIQEQRETANVRVLDPAVAPEQKSRPPRRLIVMIAAGGSVLMTLIGVMIIEYFQSLQEKNAGDWEKVNQIFSVIRRRKMK